MKLIWQLNFGLETKNCALRMNASNLLRLSLCVIHSLRLMPCDWHPWAFLNHDFRLKFVVYCLFAHYLSPACVFLRRVHSAKATWQHSSTLHCQCYCIGEFINDFHFLQLFGPTPSPTISFSPTNLSAKVCNMLFVFVHSDEG